MTRQVRTSQPTHTNKEPASVYDAQNTAKEYAVLFLKGSLGAVKLVLNVPKVLWGWFNDCREVPKYRREKDEFAINKKRQETQQHQLHKFEGELKEKEEKVDALIAQHVQQQVSQIRQEQERGWKRNIEAQLQEERRITNELRQGKIALRAEYDEALRQNEEMQEKLSATQGMLKHNRELIVGIFQDASRESFSRLEQRMGNNDRNISDLLYGQRVLTNQTQSINRMTQDNNHRAASIEEKLRRTSTIPRVTNVTNNTFNYADHSRHLHWNASQPTPSRRTPHRFGVGETQVDALEYQPDDNSTALICD